MVKNLVIDCHVDTLLKKYFGGMIPLLGGKKQELHVSKDFLIQGGVDILVLAIFIPPKLTGIGIEVTLEMISLAKKWKRMVLPLLHQNLI